MQLPIGKTKKEAPRILEVVGSCRLVDLVVRSRVGYFLVVVTDCTCPT